MSLPFVDGSPGGERATTAFCPLDPRTRKAVLDRPAPSCLLDDRQTVAVRVSQGEHRRHARPAEQLADLDAVGPQLRVDGGGVRGRHYRETRRVCAYLSALARKFADVLVSGCLG